jgi:uncharacterized protein
VIGSATDGAASKLKESAAKKNLPVVTSYLYLYPFVKYSGPPKIHRLLHSEVCHWKGLDAQEISKVRQEKRRRPPRGQILPFTSEAGRTMSTMAIDVLDGTLFRKLFMGGVRWVAFHRDMLNNLNVYPVPDGDTGTNMYLTLRGAVSSFRLAADGSLGSLLRAMARGALFGARGNSGVILSQILSGFAGHFKGKDRLSAEDLYPAFLSASKRAYQALSDPKEGTILTVTRILADSLKNLSFPDGDLLAALEHIHGESSRALRDSRDLLPILKENDVVDAGGLGLVYLFEGMLRAARFEDFRRRRRDAAPAAFQPMQALESLVFPFCVEFIVRTTAEDRITIKTELEKMGDSLVMATSGDLLKIHLHTDAPASVRGYCGSLGDILQEKQDNMMEQHRSLLLGDEIKEEREELASTFANLTTALAAIVNGDGFIDIFASSGAYIIRGGQSMNPSVQEITDVLACIPTESVLLLANNGNCIAACEQAAGLIDKKVTVLPTQDMVRGLLFLNHYDPSLPMDELVQRYDEAMPHYSSVEICRAKKEAIVGTTPVASGAWMALSDGSLVACSGDFRALIEKLIKSPLIEGRKQITLVSGMESIDGVDDPLSLAREFLDHSDVELNLVHGGQPHYPLLLGLR